MAEAITRDLADLIEGQQSGRLPLQIMLCSCALMAIEGYDMQVTGYAAPAMIADLHITKVAFAPVFSLGMIGYMVGAILLGTLSDRIGRKRVIIAGTCTFGILTLATAFTRDLTLITALRALAGAGLGAGIPATIALSAEYAPIRVRGRRTTLLYTGYTLGGALSGGVAAQLLGVAGWPSLFVVGGLMPLLIAAVIAFVVPESACFLALRPARRGDLARVLKRLRPDLVIGEHDRFSLAETTTTRGSTRGLFAEGRAPVTTLLWSCFILNFVALHFITSWLPTILYSAGLSLSRAAIVSSTFLIGGAIGGIVAGRFLDKSGMRKVAGMIFLAIPCLLGIGFSNTSFVSLALMVCLSGFTMMGGQIGLNAVSGMIYPTAIRSTGVGWALGVGRIGSVIGPALGGLLLSFQLPAQLIFEVAAVPVFACAGCLFALSRLRAAQHGMAQPADAGRLAAASTTQLSLSVLAPSR